MPSSFITLSSPHTQESWEIPVLYEDEHLLAVSKPSGLLTSPDRYDPNRPNLMRLLHTGIEKKAGWASKRNLSYLMNPHRLDFETSGIIILARSKPVLIGLTNQFGAEKPVKIYHAIATGSPELDQFEVDAAIGEHPVKTGLMRVDAKKGKKSKTKFQVLERFRHYTLLSCQPLTGRTHQIRVHCRYAGLPLAGDELYGGAKLWLSEIKRRYKPKPEEDEKPLIGRVALHALQLELPHPVSGVWTKIQDEMPRDLEVAVKYLRRFG